MSFLVLSDVITEREYTSDIPESNKQKGIRCFKFFELVTARKKSVESNFRIAYVCETVELAKSLERPTRGLTILAENTGAVSSHSISSFIINNKDINKINQNLLNDYSRLVGKDYSLFVSNLKKHVVLEDQEYLNTLDLKFEFLIDSGYHSWEGIR